jgi:hypothetical protein
VFGSKCLHKGIEGLPGRVASIFLSHCRPDLCQNIERKRSLGMFVTMNATADAEHATRKRLRFVAMPLSRKDRTEVQRPSSKRWMVGTQTLFCVGDRTPEQLFCLRIFVSREQDSPQFIPPYSRPQRIARRAGRFSRENLAIRTEERAA